MKRLSILLLLLLPFPLFGQATTGYHRTAQVIARGNEGVLAQIVPGARVSVTLTSTGAAATIYSDPLLSSPIASSMVTTDISGNYGYYIPLNVCVTETISKLGGGNIIVPNICNNSAGSSGGVIDINGVMCAVGGSCALPPYCAGPTCANLDQNNPDFATPVITTTAAITSSSLVIPVVSTTGWPSTGCGWTNGSVEGICWDSITPTSLVLNQLSLRRGINGYSAVSHGSGTNIEGAIFTLAASATTPQLQAISTGGQIGFNNGINPGLAQSVAFNGNALFEAQAQMYGKLTLNSGLEFNSGPILTSASSNTSQIVTCVPGTGVGDVCNDLGVWVAPGGGSVGPLTPNYLPIALTSSTLGDSPIDFGATTAGVVTIAGVSVDQSQDVLDVDRFPGDPNPPLAITGGGGNGGIVQVWQQLIIAVGEDPTIAPTDSICLYTLPVTTGDMLSCLNGNSSGVLTLGNGVDGSGNLFSSGSQAAASVTLGLSYTSGVSSFVALNASSSLTTAPTAVATFVTAGEELNYLTPSTSPLCYPTGSPSVVTNDPSICTGGGLSGLVSGYIPIANSTTTVTNSTLDYNITNTGDFTFGAPVLMPFGSEVDGSAICTTATGCGSASLTLTTTGTSGAATFSSGVLNVPVYVSPSGAYLALNPASAAEQTVTTQPGDTTTFAQTSVGNVGVVLPNVFSMFSYGQGWNCGNNGTACGTPPSWATQDALTLNAYSATRGIMQGLKLNCDKDALGDFACIYGYPECFGGGQDASGERCQGMTLQMTEAPWFNGALVTPSVGTISGAHGPSASGSTYVWVGGNGGPVTFQTSGAIQSFSVDFTSAATAQTGYLGIATPNGGGSFTLSAPATVSVAAGAGVQTWTPADFGTINAAAGQTIYFYVATGNAPANGSFTGASFSGIPSAGTFTTSAASGLLMTAVLATPTAGANSITLATLNCNVNCTNPRIGSSLPDGGIIINTTETTSSWTLGAESTIQGGLSYALTAGTTSVSTAWGNIIPSSCTPNPSGHFQVLTAVTCTVTLGTSPASLGHFTTSGGIGSCSTVATSPGTSSDIHISGPFSEESYVTAVTTGSTTDSITFCTRNPWNAGAARVMQGGPQSEAFVSNAAISAGWPVAYAVDGAFTSTQVAFSNCINGSCTGPTTGNILSSGAVVTVYSAAYTTGTGNGAVNTATLGTNAVPFTVGDNIVGAPSSEVSLEAVRLICGQWTPLDGAEPSSCLQLTDTGGSRMNAMIRLGNAGSSGSPGAFMIQADTGFWSDTIKLAHAPINYLVEIQSHSGTTNGILEYDDSFSNLSFVDTGANFYNEVLNWSQTFNAYAYEANGSLGTAGQCLTSDGTAGPATWATCGPSGTVTSVSVTTANGVSGSVATATTTPAITLTLGAINPSSTGQTTAGPGSFTTLTATSGLGIGSSPPTACAGLSGCAAFAEAGTAVAAAAGVDTMRADSSHLFKIGLNGGSEFTSLMNFSTVNLASSAAGGVSGALPNSNLANPFTTVNGQTCVLGGSCTVSTAVSNSISSTIPGTGISAVSCSTAACTNLRGTYTMTATTVSAGAILTLVWPTATSAYACSVSQNGGATSLGLSHSVASATGMAVSVAVSVATGSITFDYSCQP